MRAKTILKRNFGGISWQHPLARASLPAIDRVDSWLRRRRNLGDLPPYSVRVRGTGVSGEFGGRKYVRSGDRLAMSLIRFAGLTSSTHMLEVGPGAGRVAYSVSHILDGDGRYVGLDIDAASVMACQQIPRLDNRRFRFVHANLQSDLYNASGSILAAKYRFPFPDESFDIVYLQSVFTHLTSEESANYAKECLRVLRPGGRVVVSCFLIDYGVGDSVFTFGHREGDVFVEHPSNPRKAVATTLASFQAWFGEPPSMALKGTWRGGAGDWPGGQDWLLFVKSEELAEP